MKILPFSQDMRSRNLWIVLLTCLMVTTATTFAQQNRILLKSSKKQKGNFTEQINFEDMVKRYLTKESTPAGKLEGIYSVSAMVTKRGGFLSNPNKEKVMTRKDNYATVVIIKNSGKEDREYLSVSLDSKIPGRYPVVGEFTTMSNGGTFLYKHYQPETTGMSFTFVLSEYDLLDGILTKVEKRKTITYKLSYLKIYPRKEDVSGRQLSNNR